MKKLLYILTITLLLAACVTDNADNAVVSEGLLTIPNVPDHWTYVSLTEGRVVGTCSLNDTAAQHQWAARQQPHRQRQRRGGDSGSGQGAAAVSPLPYEQTDATQPAHYVNDRDSVAVW